MQVSISTACFFPLDTERALKQLIQEKEQNIEIFLNSFSELRCDFIQTLKNILGSSENKITAIHPFTSNLEDMLFSPSERRREDMRDFYKQYFFIAAELGAPYVILHGPNKMFHMSRSFYAEQLDALDQIAQNMGVSILQENIARCLSRNMELLSYLNENVPQIGYTLDIKQAIRCKIPVDDYLHCLGSKIKHIHISDHDERSDCIYPGDGMMDIPAFLESLSQIGYSGALSIEIYGCKENQCGKLIKSAQLLRSYIQERQSAHN